MTKKHHPGFVPVDFKLVGKISISIGLALAVFWLVAALLNWNIIPMAVLFIGLMFIIVGLYLLFVVPKE